jgi:signal transduction histidine kinase
MEVASHGQLLTAVVPGDWTDSTVPRRLLFREARFRGVHAAVADAERRLTGVRLYVSSLDHIFIEQGEDVNVFAQREHRVDELLRFVPESRRRVRVHGTVTLLLPGEGVFIRGAGGSVFAALEQSERSSETAGIHVGDRLDVAGYPVLRQDRVILEDAVWQHRGRSSAPLPLERSAAEAQQPAYDGELISIEGVLLNELRRGGRQLLILRHGEVDLTAEQVGFPDGAKFPELLPGSTLRITGVSRPEASVAEGGARTLRVLMRGLDDVVVVRKPSPWTLKRALLALGTVTLGAAASIVWSLVLRRRVLQQTAVIAEKIEGERISQERSRIARDLHDSLQQELAGIGMQLSTTDKLLTRDADAARRSLELARSMLRRSQEEARRSIWDLQPLDLTTGDLGSALCDLFQPLDDHDGPAVEVKVAGDTAHIPPLVEAHLLRVAQEAVTNSLKHGAASRLLISLTVGDEGITLQIRDDGCGFDANHSDVVARYKFGLSSMRERANKMDASLSIESAPGKGTTITILVPRNAASLNLPSLSLN